MTEKTELSETKENWPDDHLLEQWKTGDQHAAEILYQRYSLRLVALVASRLSRRFRGEVDAEEVVQSALGSFFFAARQSRIQVSGQVSLWRLLATFVRRKLSAHLDRQLALKRGGGRQRVPFSSSDTQAIAENLVGVSLENLRTDDARSSVIASGTPTGIDELSGRIEHWLVHRLSADQSSVLRRVLAGQTHQQIAIELKTSERTVRRRLAEIKELYRNGIAEQESAWTSKQGVHSDSIPDLLVRGMPRIDYREFVMARMVGSGGFGKVYLAAMQATENRVAVKFLRKSFWQDTAALHAFVREIETASALDHPGIVRYLGWGKSRHGGPYVVTEWIDGQTLERLREIDEGRFRGFVIQLCEAIHAVHSAGLVHGDLTPTNLMINDQDQLKVTDFGFSRSLGARNNTAGSDVSQSSGHPTEHLPLASVVSETQGGTLGFAAPEQISPAFGTIGAWTDLFAIGGIVFWYLTGHPPLARGSLGESIRATVMDEPLHLTDLARIRGMKRSTRWTDLLAMTLRAAPVDRADCVLDILNCLED